MKKKHLVSLVSTIKNTLHAHSKADWDNKEVVETVAEVITKSFAKYISESYIFTFNGKIKSR